MTGNAFDRYDTLLSAAQSDDYWSDLGIEEAVESLGRFGPADWLRLTAELSERPASWQERCAQTLGDTEDAHAWPLLRALIGSADRNVVVAAMDSARSHAGDVSPRDRELLAQALECLRAGPTNAVEKAVMGDLTERLGASWGQP